MINESMARRYWPKGNALGSTIVVNKIQRQIVGIVHDFAYHSPDNTDPNPVVFLPMLQGKSGYGYAIIAVHARAGADSVAAQLRKAITGLDSSLPIENVRTLEDITGAAISDVAHSGGIARRLRHLQRACRHDGAVCSNGLLRDRTQSRVCFTYGARFFAPAESSDWYCREVQASFSLGLSLAVSGRLQQYACCVPCCSMLLLLTCSASASPLSRWSHGAALPASRLRAAPRALSQCKRYEPSSANKTTDRLPFRS